MTAWLLRAGRGAQYADDWFEHNYVAVYWHLDGLALYNASRKQVKERVDQLYADKSPQARAMITGQVYRFGTIMQIKDQVVTYDPAQRKYHIGIITGDCILKQAKDESDSRYMRKVSWERTVPRDELSVVSRNSLGTIATLSLINEGTYADLTRKQQTPNFAKNIAVSDENTSEESTDDDEIRTVTEEEAIERIKDRILSLDWDEMELLTAGLLRAMGYRTMMTSKGGDQGRDIIASPDGLGLSSPRIVVEVKHRKDSMSAPALRSFIAGLHESDRGLYVSTGGFTKESIYEAERARIPVTLLDLDHFARFFVDNYESTDIQTHTLLPLTRIYWPA